MYKFSRNKLGIIQQVNIKSGQKVKEGEVFGSFKPLTEAQLKTAIC